MAETFKFELVSPERLLMSQQVREVVVPGSDGEFGVLSGHAPFMSTIRPGFIVVKPDEGDERKIYIRGGFADTGPGGLTILAEQAVPLEELDANAIADEIKHADEDRADAKTDEDRAAVQTRLDRLHDVQAALAAL
jgi:F-type H+-transporting ATPase subunit epsilon